MTEALLVFEELEMERVAAGATLVKVLRIMDIMVVCLCRGEVEVSGW